MMNTKHVDKKTPRKRKLKASLAGDHSKAGLPRCGGASGNADQQIDEIERTFKLHYQW